MSILIRDQDPSRFPESPGAAAFRHGGEHAAPVDHAARSAGADGQYLHAGDAQGMSVGALVTGATVSWLGVQHALLLSGAVAVTLQLVLVRMWLRAPTPGAGVGRSAA